MKTYTIYRAIFADNIGDIDLENIGQSFAQHETLAEEFSNQFFHRGNYFIVKAEVTESQINIDQTNAQWNAKDWSKEGEVVLKPHQEIKVTIGGNTMLANTGFCRFADDETRPNPIDCDPCEVTDYLQS